MPVTADILERRAVSFLLWSPARQSQPPVLLIGRFSPGNPPSLASVNRFPLAPVANCDGLWSVAAADCGLNDNFVYHYWLIVDDSRSNPAAPPTRIAVTDPFACSVDWRIFPHDADPAAFPASELTYEQPAAVIRYMGGGALAESDPGGEAAGFGAPDQPDNLAPNNQCIICEVPGAWLSSLRPNTLGRGAATFTDVTALIDEDVVGANFSDLVLLQRGNAYLADLGVNVVELLPAADSYYKREWGYDTSHYLAPDAELGFPEGDLSPTANRDLSRLVDACHRKGIRFFADVATPEYLGGHARVARFSGIRLSSARFVGLNRELAERRHRCRPSRFGTVRMSKEIVAF